MFEWKCKVIFTWVLCLKWCVLYTMSIFLKKDFKNRNRSPCLQNHNIPQYIKSWYIWCLSNTQPYTCQRFDFIWGWEICLASAFVLIFWGIEYLWSPPKPKARQSHVQFGLCEVKAWSRGWSWKVFCHIICLFVQKHIKTIIRKQLKVGQIGVICQWDQHY